MKYLLIIIGFSVLTFFLKGQQPPQQDKSVSLTLTVTEVSTVMKGLAELPLKETGDLYFKIQNQAQRQLNPPIPPVPVDTSKAKKKP